MQSQLQPSGFGACKCGSKSADVALGRVAAEVDADDAAGAVGEGEVDDMVCFGGRGAAVNGQDEEGTKRVGRMAVVRVEDVEHGFHI